MSGTDDRFPEPGAMHNPYKAPGERRPTAAEADGPSGIGGWLLFPLVHMVIAPLVILIRVIYPLVSIVNLAEPTLPDIMAEHAVGWPWVIFTLIANSILICLCGAAFVTGILKIAPAPRLFISYYILQAVVSVVDNTALLLIFSGGLVNVFFSVVAAFISVIVAVVWTAYFLNSKRVRNTFGKA